MTNPQIDSKGNKRWCNYQGRYHRDDGPAVEMANGDKCWYKNNKLHREDGPAIELSDGSKAWYIRDKRIE